MYFPFFRLPSAMITIPTNRKSLSQLLASLKLRKALQLPVTFTEFPRDRFIKEYSLEGPFVAEFIGDSTRHYEMGNIVVYEAKDTRLTNIASNMGELFLRRSGFARAHVVLGRGLFSVNNSIRAPDMAVFVRNRNTGKLDPLTQSEYPSVIFEVAMKENLDHVRDRAMQWINFTTVQECWIVHVQPTKGENNLSSNCIACFERYVADVATNPVFGPCDLTYIPHRWLPQFGTEIGFDRVLHGLPATADAISKAPKFRLDMFDIRCCALSAC